MLDPTATPWRTLEDPPATTAAGAPEAGGRAAVPRSAFVAGAAAITLAIGAFALAFGSGSTGAVVVDGGAPVDAASSGLRAGGDPVAGGAGGRVLVVEIVGAVDHPGVFRLAPDARVGDLVTAAGGFGPRVDTARAASELNLAAPLHDGDQIRVPSRDDPIGSPVGGRVGAGGVGSTVGGSGSVATGPVSLNRASVAELDALPGIGPVTANRIVASRDERPFTAVGDLRTRKLVGEKTFEKLKALVTVP